MQIRLAEADDAAALAQLYHASVTMLGARDYSAEQVAVWATLAPSAERFRAMMTDGRLLLVAVDGGTRLAAFGDLEAEGHIDYLYSAPFAAATGAAAALYAEIERRARVTGLHRLHAEASEAARRFFLRRGFVVTARRDFEVDGVPIHNYAVEKLLV